jgi:hypothetical protein
MIIRLNVEMARSLGMRAEIVRGIEELKAILTTAGILTDASRGES